MTQRILQICVIFAVALMAGCASAPAYVAPAGVSDAKLSSDLSDCRQVAGMQRDPVTQDAIELDCMTARGYAPAHAP